MAAQPAPSAAEVYLATVEASGPGRPRLVAALRAVRLAVGAMAGWYDEPSAGDLVVRRRDDGREVLRVDAGTSEEASVLQRSVREQLASTSAPEFRAAWDIVDPAMGPVLGP